MNTQKASNVGADWTSLSKHRPPDYVQVEARSLGYIHSNAFKLRHRPGEALNHWEMPPRVEVEVVLPGPLVQWRYLEGKIPSAEEIKQLQTGYKAFRTRKVKSNELQTKAEEARERAEKTAREAEEAEAKVARTPRNSAKAYLATVLICNPMNLECAEDVDQELDHLLTDLGGSIVSVETAKIGPWHDDHPLNHSRPSAAVLAKYFKKSAKA